MQVTLVERYNPQWPSHFRQLCAYLGPALAGLEHTIEHVGSTAIPDMTAKPIIDLIIVIAPGTSAEARQRLLALGYAYRGDQGIPGREAFRLCDGAARPQLPAHHLYVCEEGAFELRKQVAFRDYMRGHPESRARLSAQKWALCLQHANDRALYIAGKDAMVQEITMLALKEAGIAQSDAPTPSKET